MDLTFSRIKSLRGEFRPPSDKSLTHRAYMFAAASDGPCVVRHPLMGEDCHSTLQCMAQLGLGHEWLGNEEVRLIPVAAWKQPDAPLDCGNSGTTMRLLSGLVASRKLEVTLVGDASLSRRPMKRIAEPLRLMGADVEGDTPPLRIRGGALRGIEYNTPVPSAQIKSAVLLAGLQADGATNVTEPALSRDHTERMLSALGVILKREGLTVTVHPQERLNAFEFGVPADISSSAFMLVAAALLPASDLTLRSVGVNPTRTGVLDVLQAAGASIELSNERDELGEPVADIGCRPGELRAFEISGELVPRLIDEIPVLAVLASQCEGTTRIRDAAEMRVKESDRIDLVASGLRAMGANVEVFPDGMAITGPTPLRGAHIEAKLDHRIAMAFAVAGLIAEGETAVSGAEAINTSFPGFEDELRRLAVV